LLKRIGGGLIQQSVDEKKEMNKTIAKTCLISNIVYLVAHIAYLIWMSIYGLKLQLQSFMKVKEW
jgi:hypothetical protein